MEKKAKFWHQLNEKTIQCDLCPHFCKIVEGKVGICKVRKNIDGELCSLVYNYPISPQVDPIEKKPLFNFLKNTKTLSFGTVGCNLRCQHCQNYHISKATPNSKKELLPKKIVELALENNCKSISYTYNEPTIFIELILDIAKEAKKQGLKNIVVSNGFINKKPLLELCKYIDAWNIDLKAFNEKFYNRICAGELNPVLETLKTIYDQDLHLEITNLIIPSLNDDLEEFEDMCDWISQNLDDNVPLHITRFFPYNELNNLPITSIETLKKAEKIAKKYLKNVYLGNI